MSSPGTLKGTVPVVLFDDVISVALKEETKFESLGVGNVEIYAILVWRSGEYILKLEVELLW